MSGLGPLLIMISLLRERLKLARQDERGMTTETMIITALLAAAALTAVGLIVDAILNRAPDIVNDIGGTGA